jgi:chromosome segregation ATPase
MKWDTGGVILWVVVAGLCILMLAVGSPKISNIEATQDWQARKVLKLDKANGEHRRAIADIESTLKRLDNRLEEMDEAIEGLNVNIRSIAADVYDLEKWQTHVEEKVPDTKMPKTRSRYAPGGYYGG